MTYTHIFNKDVRLTCAATLYSSRSGSYVYHQSSPKALYAYTIHLGEMELKRIVGTQANIQSRLEEIRKGVSFICQEEGIVAQRAHRDSNLLQVEQILKSGYFTQQDSVRDRMSRQEC